MIRRGAGGAVMGLALLLGSASHGLAEDNVYTVAKYPIEAEAGDAVTAKSLAMVDGQDGAFHALLKRIVPVTSYTRLPRPKSAEIEALTDGLNIRSEQNSSTEYLAEIDYQFNPQRVRRYLQKERLPFLDRQAPEVLLVPIYRNTNASAPRFLATASGQRAWREAWAGLDLENALTPVKLAQYKLEIRADVRQRLSDGDMSVLRIFQEEYGASRILLASAEPDISGNKLLVSISGQDAVGTFSLRRSYTIEDNDLPYTAELATIVGLGVIEGRWKEVSGDSGSDAFASGPAEQIRFFVRFNGLREWQDIRARLANLPGVDGFDTGTVSARGAEVAMNYPGGLAGLSRRVAGEGMSFAQSGNDWILQQN